MTTSDPTSPAGREARFRAVHEATYADLLRFAQRRVPPGQAEDVAADVFLVAWRRLDDLPVDVADARPWLFGVARATILNHRRGVRRRDALAVRLAEVAPGVGDGEDLAAARLDLARGWALLTAGEQEAISLAVWDGLTSAEAGVVLGCSATAYRLRLSRARRALRGHVGAAPAATSSRTSATAPEGPRR